MYALETSLTEINYRLSALLHVHVQFTYSSRIILLCKLEYTVYKTLTTLDLPYLIIITLPSSLLPDTMHCTAAAEYILVEQPVTGCVVTVHVLDYRLLPIEITHRYKCSTKVHVPCLSFSFKGSVLYILKPFSIPHAKHPKKEREQENEMQ